MQIIRLESVDSTNNYTRAHVEELPAESVVVAESQTEGRGQGSNHWHSTAGKNLTFSVLLKPKGVRANRQFVYSKAIALAVADALDDYCEGISVKWPNDVYQGDRKISGTLIECGITGESLRYVVIGTGVNINETSFPEDIPNPVSLCQIVGKEVDCEEVLQKILDNLEGYAAMISDQSDDFIGNYYWLRLYRNVGFHSYRDSSGDFLAEVAGIESDGRMLLRLEDGSTRSYGFKEVEFKPRGSS